MRNYKPYKKHSRRNMEGGDIENSKYSHIEPVQAQPLQVVVYNSFDRAMVAFRTMFQKERILSTYKEKSRYEKPSDKKRRKRNEMKRKLMELEVKENYVPKVKKSKDKQ